MSGGDTSPAPTASGRARDSDVVRAAGTVPWRLRSDTLEVGLVHRAKYDDWSWPKGKLDPDEPWPVAATRETYEEMGLWVRLGVPLPSAHYALRSSRPDQPQTKHVRYWAAQVVGGEGRLENEIDAVAWLDPAQARDRLSYERDRDQLDALVGAHTAGHLDAQPFGIVRHAKATPRKEFSGRDDWLRPLDKRGTRQAAALPDLLAAYGFRRVVSSSSTRCVDTVAPYARAAGLDLETSRRLSEEGFAKAPERSIAKFDKVLAQAPQSPSLVCSHGPLLPDLVRRLVPHASGATLGLLERAADENLDKGEVLVAYLALGSDDIHVVDAERHPPTL